MTNISTSTQGVYDEADNDICLYPGGDGHAIYLYPWSSMTLISAFTQGV